MRPVSIRLATPDDLPALAGVHHRSQEVAYVRIFPPDAPAPSVADVEAAWRRALAGTAVALVASDGEKVLGGVVARTGADEAGFGHFQKLYVDPEAWGHGIGHRLHDAAVAWLAGAGIADATLWVLSGNDRARRCYERWGWTLDTASDATFTHPGLPVTEVRYRRSLARPTT